MNWKRIKKNSASGGGGGEMRERLIPSASGGDAGGAGCVPRGCVAVLVGADDEPAERLVVEVRALGQPCVRALLDMAKREFGYDQKGVLRIPCPADEFRRAVAVDSHHRRHRCRC